jgi:3'-5' exoribonuclease
MRYISDLREGEKLVEFYLCKVKQTFQSKNGKNYLSLTLQDKTGTISGKVWDLNNGIQSFESGDFIKIDAMVQTYQNDLQLNIHRIRKAQEGEYDPADYIPTTNKDVNELYNKLTAYIDSIKTPCIKELLNNIFMKHPLISKKIKTHTAAKSMHHNYMGGLLEHTISVTDICDFFASHYTMVDRDLLISTALLHDVGKIIELSDFPNIDYTDEGELIGHIVMGSELIGAEADKIEGFPKELKSLIKHSILAHHGEFEYGSPKLPKTLEAFLLHVADDTDAKERMFEDIIESDNTMGAWTGYNKLFARNIRKSEYKN